MGPVCVTNAHVFSSKKQAWALDRDTVFINGHPAILRLDGWKKYKRDIALIEVPDSLMKDVHFHPMGHSDEKYRLFYTIGWSLNERTNARVLKKIYGQRDLSTSVPGGGSSIATFWELSGYLPEPDSPSGKFQSGWSGAPVFNVRPLGEEDHVVGILQAVTSPNRATAYAVQSVDVLRPSIKQQHEGRTIRTLPPWWKKFLIRDDMAPQYAIGYEDSYHDLKHEEILGEAVKRPQCRPPSPYDYAIEGP